MDQHQAGSRPAHPRPQPLRRRRLPHTRDRPRGDRPVATGRVVFALRPCGPRHQTAGRRLHARGRVRPRTPQRRQLEGDRGQRPHPLRDLLRAGEPGGDGPARSRALRLLPGAPDRPLPTAAAGRPAGGGPVGRKRGHGRRLDPGPGQPRLLRARLPGAPDGRRAGGSVRPRGTRRRALHAHDQRPRAGPRRVPQDRRRLRRPARVPGRLAARRAGAGAGLPGGQRRDRQRARYRRRRRQGRLPLRPGDDPLLPRRGADPRERSRPICRRTPKCSSTCSSASTSWW